MLAVETYCLSKLPKHDVSLTLLTADTNQLYNIETIRSFLKLMQKRALKTWCPKP